MSDFKYCLLKYGDLSSEEEKKLRSVFPKLIKYDPVVHTKSPLQIGEYDILFLNVKPGLFGGESEGFKYFKANKWDEFVLVYVYESRKNVEYVVNAQFKVRNLPLGFVAKDEFISCVLETSNSDSDLIAREPKTPAAPKQVVISEPVSSLVLISEKSNEEQPSQPVLEKPVLAKDEKQQPVAAAPPEQQNQLIDSLNKLSAEYEKSVSDVTDLKRKILSLEADVTRLTNEKQNLASKVELLGQLEAELIKLKAEKATFEKRLPELEEVAKLLEVEKQKTTVLATQIADHASVKSELQKLKDEHSQKLSELGNKSDEVKQLLTDKSELQSTLVAQQDEVKKVAVILAKIREEHAVVAADHAKIKESEAQRVSEIVKLRSENLKLKQELDLVKEQLRLLKSACTEEETKSATLQSKISQLTQSINTLQSINPKPAENSSTSTTSDKVSVSQVVNKSNDSFRENSQKEQKPDSNVSSQSVSSASTSVPNSSDSSKKASTQTQEVKIVTDASFAGKKIKELPQEIIECKYINQQKNSVVVEYFDTVAWARTKRIFSFVNDPNQNAGIIRQAIQFYKERQADIKRELLK
jgi:DNA repair exonuclease SbcCD ATPase subunit